MDIVVSLALRYVTRRRAVPFVMHEQLSLPKVVSLTLPVKSMVNTNTNIN